MSTAIVLINAGVGQGPEVVQELKTLEGIQEATEVYGSYDVLAILTTDNVNKTVMNLKGIEGVRSVTALTTTD